MMRDKLLHFIQDNHLIFPNTIVTCAVSGGADSMALLWGMYTIKDDLHISIRCAHFNHGLRADADADESFVRDFCNSYDIPFVSERVNVAKQTEIGESIEIAARRLRYDFLYRASEGGLLATAHTANDNLETLLLRLTRGTSPRGLAGIPLQQGTLIRPLLFASRDEINQFLLQESISHCEDPTNQTDFCPRNRIRHHVVPLLQKENPNIISSVLSLTQTMREEDAFLSSQAQDALKTCELSDGWDVQALQSLPIVLQRRALFSILQQCGILVPTQRHWEQLRAIVFSDCPSAQAIFPGNIVLQRRYNLLCLGECLPDLIPQTPLHIPGTTYLPQIGITITCSKVKNVQKIENSSVQFILGCDKISNVIVRSRQSGDSIHLSGGSRSLKRLMIDRKIPAALRNLVPVLADDTGVIAVFGIGADVSRLAKPGENAIRIQIEKEAIKHES